MVKAKSSRVLEDALEYIADKPRWDLDDGIDAIASDVYFYWCEYVN